MGLKAELNEEQKRWIDENQLPDSFKLNNKTLYIIDLDENNHCPNLKHRQGKKGFVLSVQDEYGSHFAAKIALPSDYVERTETDEMKYAAKTRGDNRFCFPVETGRVQKFNTFPSESEEMVCFLLPWVEGITLKQFIQKTPDKITPEIIIELLKKIHQGISILARKGLKHDDLHDDNIMLKKPDPDTVFSENEKIFEVVLIDTGSLKLADKTTAKAYDDDTHFIRNAIKIYNCFIKNREVCTQYPIFKKELDKFITIISDDDPSRFSLTNTDQVVEIQNHIRHLETAITNSSSNGQAFHPFEAISAEHLADDKTLLKLFVDKLPWIQGISGKAPTLLTGPRGCGKSMVFRYLSAKTHLSAGDITCPQTLIDMNFLGIYISCSNELQNYLHWLVRDGQVKGNELEIATFFQLICLRELYKTLSIIITNPGTNSLYLIDNNAIQKSIQQFDLYIPQESGEYSFSSLTIAKRMVYRIDRLKSQLNKSFINREKSPIRLPYTALSEITQIISENSQGLTTRPITFLLDDYTTHRLGEDIQQILNKVIWERRKSHIFKISAEKLGICLDEIDKSQIDQGREFIDIDAGRMGVNSTDNERIAFVKELLDARLENSSWLGRAEILLGNGPYNSDDELAFACQKAATQGKSYPYCGLKTISNLWSGDIAHILSVLNKIFLSGNVTSSTTTKIPDHIQHEAILGASKSFYNRISSFHPYGNEMQMLVDKFGRMLRTVMLEGEPYKNKGKPVPRRLLRIDTEHDNPNLYLEDLEKVSNLECKEITKELLRRALFIELPNSRSKDKKTTFRWQIRSLLLPHFGLSFKTSGAYIDLKSIEEFSSLVADTDQFCIKQTAKYKKADHPDMFNDKE